MPEIPTLSSLSRLVHRGWAAPELDWHSRSKQSDIFSLACTVYEVLIYFLDLSSLFIFSHFCSHKMFTRQPPYEWNSSATDRSRPPARIGLLMREEWNKLWEILEDCWSTDPLDRPTASELEARLRKTFQPEPLALHLENRNFSFSTITPWFTRFIF